MPSQFQRIPTFARAWWEIRGRICDVPFIFTLQGFIQRVPPKTLSEATLLSLTATSLANFTDRICFISEFHSHIVSGSVIWACRSTKGKTSQTTSRKRKWKTCPSVLETHARVFHNPTISWCQQTSERAELDPVQTADWTGPVACRQGENAVSGFSQTLSIFGRRALKQVPSDGERKEACSRNRRVINPHSESAALCEDLPKSWSNRRRYSWLVRRVPCISVCVWIKWELSTRLQSSGDCLTLRSIQTSSSAPVIRKTHI